MEATPQSSAERILDLAIEFTFPASDPIAVEQAFLSARRRDRNLLKEEPAMGASAVREAKARRTLEAAGAFSPAAITALANALNGVLADSFALYLKTKNFHWHVSGPHFRDYHLMFDEQAAQILAATDGMAERVRKIGGTTLRSIGHIAKLQRLKDNDAASVAPAHMLHELMLDNQACAHAMREAHALAGEHGDVASASLLENWIDEAELRAWFLLEAGRDTAA